MTDPDLVELAEDLAERIRVMLFEHDDEVEDRIIAIADNHFRVMELMSSDDDRIEQAIEGTETFVVDTLLRLLEPMMFRIVKSGDWRVSDPSETNTYEDVT